MDIIMACRWHDFPNPLLPLVNIVLRTWLVFRATFYISTGLM